MLPILTGDRGTMPMQKLQVSRWNRNRPPAFPTPMATCCHQFGHSLWLSLLPCHCQLCIWMLRILCYDPGNLLLVLQGSTPRSPPACLRWLHQRLCQLPCRAPHCSSTTPPPWATPRRNCPALPHRWGPALCTILPSAPTLRKSKGVTQFALMGVINTMAIPVFSLA